MDTNSKQQYMNTIREEKKYAIKKFLYKVKLKNPEERKHRQNKYSGEVISALADMCGIFDKRGQRHLYFRNSFLKKGIPLRLLVSLESVAQPFLSRLWFGPSIYFLVRLKQE